MDMQSRTYIESIPTVEADFISTYEKYTSSHAKKGPFSARFPPGISKVYLFSCVIFSFTITSGKIHLQNTPRVCFV